mgnify:FL=1
MKKIFYFLCASFAVLGISSCSIEDFLTREPINEFSAETYFASEAELEMYANGMLNSYMPDYTETAGGDAYNDLIATKTSTDFFRSDVEWDSSRQGSWSWGFLRRTNYMLDNMSRAKEKVSEDIYNHYEGVARFWRAYNYMSRIKLFSDIPWVEHYVQPSDTAILYGPRDDREYVFHMMTEDLKFACANVMNGKFKTDERSVICKDIVEAYASRFFLYEAAFRENVHVNPATNKPWNNQYETPQDLYRLAQTYAKDVIDNGGYTLVKDYPSLFISDKLIPEEVIWGKTFLTDVNGRHSYTRYFHSSTLGQQYSGTKDLVRMFLKVDGTPISDDEAKQSINTEFNGRDSRLAATVLGPGREILNESGQSAHETIDFSFCKTGYQIVKWSIPDATHFQNSIDESSIPIVRYPEVLLNYAEATEALGEMTVDIWNKTVGSLRERAGVTNVYPTERDPWLYEYYTKDLVNPATNISPVMLEIRRERVTELTFESELRQADIYRYGQADLVVRRYNGVGWAGIWVTEKEAADGLVFEGMTYTFEKASDGATNATTCYPIKSESDAVNTDWFFSEGDHGYLVYKYGLKWEPRKYCRPIPLAAYTINPALGQNYEWD